MLEKTLETSSGVIHYWINEINKQSRIALIFLPGLTADHRLFDKQVEWIDNAGHNSNTDRPHVVNKLIHEFVKKCDI